MLRHLQYPSIKIRECRNVRKATWRKIGKEDDNKAPSDEDHGDAKDDNDDDDDDDTDDDHDIPKTQSPRAS